jgi:hypothetical protein
MTTSPHGTLSRYVNLHCRCQACREANTIHHRAYRAVPVQLAKDDPRHGKASTYNNYACRCGECSLAKAEYERSRVRRTRAAS